MTDAEISEDLCKDFEEYVIEATQSLLEFLDAEKPNKETQYQVLLKLHNLKGCASSFGNEYLGEICHQLEELVIGNEFKYLDSRDELRQQIKRFPELLMMVRNNDNSSKQTQLGNLASLLYVSTRCDEITFSIEDILCRSRQKNINQNITGALLFNGDYFVQILEGDKRKLNKLFNIILNDQRHTDVMLHQFIEISTRKFGLWGMAYLPDTEATRDILRKVSECDMFNPYLYDSKTLRRAIHAILEGQLIK